MAINLSELWRTARYYGRVNIYTHDDGTCSCAIKFNTSKHVELEAKSGFKNATPEQAVAKAILEAQQIVKEFSQAFNDDKSAPLVLTELDLEALPKKYYIKG